MERNIFHVLAIILLTGLVSVSSEQWGQSEEAQEALLHNLLKEELQELRKDLTTSFVEEHSRKKRAVQNYVLEAKLEEFEGQNSSFTVSAATTLVFKKELYILETGGIYRINGLDGNSAFNRTLVSPWPDSNQHRVVATIEKGNILFILVEDIEYRFSHIYTFTSFNQSLVHRQSIRNGNGFVTAAKFFVYYDQLHLLILNDNKVHSLTVCPIFIWTSTYFDEIHTIQTRGANAVEAFEIEGYQYLAICQALDAAGNTEVGTQVVRMDRRGQLEKVQLLYSNNPVVLHYTRIFNEHILIMVQKKEPAIVYFFGGYDFVHLQYLPSLKGDQISIVSVLGPDGETYILTSSGKFIRIFKRATDHSMLTALMFTPYSNNTLEAPKGYSITGLGVKQPIVAAMEEWNSLVVAITYRRSNPSDTEKEETIVQLQKLVFDKIPKLSNYYQPPEDKLSTCLKNLKTVLDEREPLLTQLKRSNDTILRKSSNMNFHGMLNSQTGLSMASQLTMVENFRIRPDLNTEDEIKLSPSELQVKVIKDVEIFNNNLIPKLSNVLIRDETNVLSGRLDFLNGVFVQNLFALESNIKITNLNDIPWTRLDQQTLRKFSSVNEQFQVITGNWTVDRFSTGEVGTIDTISGVMLQDILLTQTESEVVQIINSPVVFGKNVEFWESVNIPPTQKINDIQVSDIVNRNNGPIEITGTKVATQVNGVSGLIVELVNQVNLDSWYNSILKTTGPDQLANGTYFFDGDVIVDNLEAELVNRVNWNNFMSQILISGDDQIITDEVHFGNLVTEAYQGDEINGVVIRDLLTASRDQTITAKIVTDHLIIIYGNISAELVNGIRIPEDVVLYGENTTIHGPIEFHGLIVDKIELADGALISGVDLEQKVKESKTVVYTLSENVNQSQPIVFTGKFYAQNAEISTINRVSIVNFTDSHWKVDGNTISTSNIDLRNFKVIVENSFNTGLIDGVPTDEYIRISGSHDEYLDFPITFTEPVIVYGDVQMGSNVTLNQLDLSEFVQKIVRQNSSGVIQGVKSFTQPIISHEGIQVGSINNKNFNDNVVMLRNGKSVYELSGKTVFSDNVEANVVVVYGNTFVGGSVNAINISQIDEITVYTNKFAVIQSDVEFLQDIDVTDFNVGNKLNNFAITHILDTLVPLDSGARSQYLTLNFVVEENVDFQGPVSIGLINGVDPALYFSALVNKSSNEFIQNQKVFHGQVVIQQALNCDDGNINNVNLQQLESQALSKTKDQTVTGRIKFQRIEAVNILTPTLCGIPVDDFALINDNNLIEIDSTVYFTTSESIVVEENISLDKYFNGQNLTKIAENLVSLQGNRTFSTVICHGNLTWTKSREYGRGLSHVLNNAVVSTGRENQTINGAVNFQQGFKATVIKTGKWLNDVDLSFLIADGVFESNSKELNFTGKNRIPKVHITNRGWLDTVPVFSTLSVNGVNLTRLNETVVRKNSTKVIRGLKILRNGIFADSLYANGVNGCSLSNLAMVNDERLINSLIFENVQGLNDLQFNYLEGIDWKTFLHDRVTLNTPQEINGNLTFNGNVFVTHCHVLKMNQLNLNELVVKNSSHVQRIRGPKTIGGLIILGSIQADSINNYDIDDIQSKILYKNRPQTINQTVYFEGPVYLYKDLEVTHHINDNHNLKNMASSFDTQLNEIIIKANSTQDVQDKSHYLLTVLREELQDSAIWLDHVSLTKSLKSLGRKNRVEVTVFGGSHARIGFSKMVPVTPENDGGLPNGCLCNAIDFIELGINYVRKIEPVYCKNIFDLASPYSDSAFTVFSTYASYNETCKSQNSDALTDVITFDVVESPQPLNLGSKLISRVSTGFISDAKLFNVHGVDYIVLAQFFDSTKGGAGEIAVYAIENPSTATLVQTIPTTGTIKLSIENINNVWFLGVANSLKSVPIPQYEDDNDECETLSEIFIWTSTSSPQSSGSFLLLREVTTKNVIDVEIIKIRRKGDDFVQAAFVAFVHSENVIEIFKFDWVTQNFYLEQTIAFDEEFQVTALTSFSLKDITYLVVSSIPQGLFVYEYRSIEGFKLYLQIPLFKVEDVSSVIVNNQLLFPVASSLETFVAKGNIQGFLTVNF